MVCTPPYFLAVCQGIIAVSKGICESWFLQSVKKKQDKSISDLCKNKGEMETGQKGPCSLLYRLGRKKIEEGLKIVSTIYIRLIFESQKLLEVFG